MNTIRMILRSMSQISMDQTSRIKQAESEAHQRNATRTFRAYRKIDRTIQNRITQAYLDL
ncbi:hypothetical protein I6J22_03705 [Corynebacterium kroppenstedtii]|uniref:hypothetical protein n=1 Tax=Corynebacterium kroppenstedtii TaxID=161879 RepID=UPI0005A2AB61|nr:hypothetical protein [Corynebacterium kroppenstedtii]QRP11181.1 hypothetical protein I6J22_03705 [Corynebacterium kroppenstedtii]